MLSDVNLALILLAALIATASPGPATLAIAGTSMASGRRYGLALAAGVTTGSLVWSIAAAAGRSAVMLANGWVFELLRYAGAAYLLFHGYALLFSSPPLTSGYTKLRRWFEAVFAVAFAGAGLKLLTAKLS